MSELPLDAAGRRRSPATMPGFHAGRPPRNKGVRYPADPPTVEEIVAVMRAAGDRSDGCRLRGLIVLLWRAGLRINEALALSEADLDRAPRSQSRPPRQGRRRREVGMDDWAWEQLEPWLANRLSCRSARCCASSPDRPAADGGAAPPRARTASRRRGQLASGGGSRRISCGTRTPSRWRTRVFR